MGLVKKMKSAIRWLYLLTKEEKMVKVPVPVNTNELLKGKVALITGGSSGIGLAIGEAFLNSGCKVILAGTSEEKLKDVVEKIQTDKKDGRVVGTVINVLDTAALPSKIRSAAELFEEGRIDILVNSAGVLNKSDYFHMTEEEYDQIMDTNVKGTFFMCQAMADYMIEKKVHGHILNVSSSSALRPAWTPYQISKWAVRGFTLGLADLLLPHGIVVNAIAPGPVATPMQRIGEDENLFLLGQPSKRFAVPSEIANLAVFMVSDMGDLIVGDSFYITGGSGTVSLHN